MIRSRPLIGQSELCLIDQNSEQFHNLQLPDEKMCSTRPSDLCLIDQNFKEIHYFQFPDEEKNVRHQNSVSLIRSLKRSITCNLLMKKNFLTDADSRTNTILERLCDLSNERPGSDHVTWGPMRGLEKNCIGRGQTHRQTHGHRDY